MGNTHVVPLNIVEERLVSLKEKRGKEVVTKGNKNCRLVKENFIDAWNHRDLRRGRNFCAPGSVAHFRGGESTMSLEQFMDSCRDLCESFPDLVLSFDRIEEISPNVVLIKNFSSRGTHTGKPFGFGPFPPVPTSGIVVYEDPFQLVLELDARGKLTKFEIEMNPGDLVGPPGYYLSIGGRMQFDD